MNGWMDRHSQFGTPVVAVVGMSRRQDGAVPTVYLPTSSFVVSPGFLLSVPLLRTQEQYRRLGRPVLDVRSRMSKDCRLAAACGADGAGQRGSSSRDTSEGWRETGARLVLQHITYSPAGDAAVAVHTYIIAAALLVEVIPRGTHTSGGPAHSVSSVSRGGVVRVGEMGACAYWAGGSRSQRIAR